MGYAIKEVYYTLQGEGALAGRAAVFCRFTGCNLWNGRERDRQTAVCSFCDTDFVGTDGVLGGVYGNEIELARAIDDCWTSGAGEKLRHRKLVVCTGGEPLLQLDSALVRVLQGAGFMVAVETNGTKLPPEGIDWICVSPKVGSQVVVQSGDELKLVFPQVGVEPTSYESLDFGRFFLQPMDGPSLQENVKLATQYCLEHPKWELSLQTHKLLGLR